MLDGLGLMYVELCSFLVTAADLDYGVEFARRVGFATVIVLDATDPVVSHLPVYVDPGDDQRPLALWFHVAIGNALAKRLDQRSQVLAIFRNVDGYISSRWYDHENVPTWNYAAVHMHGSAEPLSGSELRAHLQILLNHYDPDLETRHELIDQYLPGIRGFKMTAPRVEPVFKLSQDKNQASFEGALAGVHNRNDKTLATEMSNLKNHLNTPTD